MRPPELMQTPREPACAELLFRGTKVNPSQAPSTRPQRLNWMLAPPPVRLTCTLPIDSTRCSTGSAALHVPLLLMSWQTIQPQSQSRVPLAVVQPLVLLGIFCRTTCPLRLMASERAYCRLVCSCSAGSRTRHPSIRGVKLGAAKEMRIATMDTTTINSMAVKPVTTCRDFGRGGWWGCMAL